MTWFPAFFTTLFTAKCHTYWDVLHMLGSMMQQIMSKTQHVRVMLFTNYQLNTIDHRLLQ